MEDTLLKTLSKYQYTRDIAPVYLQSFEVNNLKYLKSQLDLHKSVKHAQLIQLYDDKSKNLQIMMTKMFQLLMQIWQP
jgi:glycerophosphoryl diester phosphodiesterase